MSWLDSVFGQKPVVPKVTPTVLSAEQQKAIEENIKSFPETAKLGDLYSSYLRSNIPGYAQTQAAGVADTQATLAAAGSELSGQIPPDVLAQIQRSDAYTSLMGGTAGSPMASALTARDLGLTSLNLINQGAALAAQGGNAAQQWQNQALQTTFNPSSMFVTPAQQAAITAQNNQNRWQQQWLQSQINAAPNPAARGISDTLVSMIQAYLSKGGGGQGTPTGPDQSLWSGGGGSFGGGGDWMSGGGGSFGGGGDQFGFNTGFNDFQPGGYTGPDYFNDPTNQQFDFSNVG